jgi:hypothetical protein
VNSGKVHEYIRLALCSGLSYERFILFLKSLFLLLLFMSIGQDYAPELRTPSALFSLHGWNVSMEPWWIGTDRGKLKISENNLFQCHFFCQPGSNPGFRRRLTAWAMVRLFSGLFRCSHVPYHKKKLFTYNFLFFFFLSFGNETPSYNSAFVENITPL